MPRFPSSTALLPSLLLAVCLPGQAGEAPLDPVRLQRIAALVRGEVETARCAGASFLVLHRGQEVAFDAVGLADVGRKLPMRRDTIVRIFSMTKVVTAVAALVLVEQQSLRLDAPVAPWLPELKAPQVFVSGTVDAVQVVPAERAITLRMLLNHTAGFTYDFLRESPVHELYRRADLWAATSTDDFLKRLAPLPLLQQPGTAWNYSVADDVLGVWIERASGLPLAEFVARHVTGPLGMVDTGFDVPEQKRGRLAEVHQLADGKLVTMEPTFGVYAEEGRGFPAGGAGLFSTIDDYARFCRMLLGGGELEGVRILGRKTVELAGLDSLRGGQRTSRPGDGWGLVSAVRTDQGASPEFGSDGMLHWSGAATTHFFVDGKEQLIGLLFCQHMPFDQHRLVPRFHTAVYQTLR